MIYTFPTATEIYSFVTGINKEAFILVADLDEKVALVVRRPGRDDPLRLLLQKEEHFSAAGVLRKLDPVSDSLTAHVNLSEAVELLRVGAERYFVNLGLELPVSCVLRMLVPPGFTFAVPT